VINGNTFLIRFEITKIIRLNIFELVPHCYYRRGKILMFWL